jgi:hypothetical protein
MADSPATKRRKLIVKVAAIGVATIMMKGFQYAPILPPPITSSSSIIDDLFRNEGERRRNVGAIALTDNHAGAPRYKSDAIFWDVYNGDDIWFYKEYRMSKTTFNTSKSMSSKSNYSPFFNLFPPQPAKHPSDEKGSSKA